MNVSCAIIGEAFYFPSILAALVVAVAAARIALAVGRCANLTPDAVYSPSETVLTMKSLSGLT